MVYFSLVNACLIVQQTEVQDKTCVHVKVDKEVLVCSFLRQLPGC